MRIPNRTYISAFPESLYTKYLNDNNRLNLLLEQYTNKYNTSKEIDARYLLIKESLDHYVLDRIIKNVNYIYTDECKRYCAFIYRINEINPCEFTTNVVFRNPNVRPFLLKTTTKSDLVKAKFDAADQRERDYEHYTNKMKATTLTQKELDKVAEYLAKGKKYNNPDYKEFIKYIMSPRVGNAVITPEVLDAITTFAPHFYSQYRYTLDYLEDVRCCVSDKITKDLSNEEEVRLVNATPKGPGASYDQYKCIFVNRKSLIGRKLTDISDSKTERLSSGSDITFINVFIYHELTHQIQAKEAESTRYTDQGLSYSVRNILHEKLQDYSYNHDSDEIELDADELGWNTSALLYNNYYSRSDFNELLANVRRNRKTADARRVFALKKDKSGNLVDKTTYDFEQISKIIASDPSKLDTYPLLKHFFNNKGGLQATALYDLNIGSYPMGKAFIKYVLLKGGISYILEQLQKGSKLSEQQVDQLNHNLYMFYLGCLDQIEYLDNAITNNAIGTYRNIPDYSDSYFINKNIEQYRMLQQEYVKQVKPLFDYMSKAYPSKARHISEYKTNIRDKGTKMQKIIASRQAKAYADQSKKTHS